MTHAEKLCDQLDNTTSLLDLSFCLFAEVPRLNHYGNLGKPALAEDFGIAERKKIEDWCGIGRFLLDQILIASFGRNERPQLDRHIH
jgi:hypothetical protein